MLTTKSDNPNYLAKVLYLKNIRPHPGADRLMLANCDSYVIITSKGASDSEPYIHFPAESKINKDYLSWSNSFSNAEQNSDKTKKGFFEKNGRCRTIKLRGVASEGYAIPATDVANWLKEAHNINYSFTDKDIDVSFDTINHDILLCEKYEIPKKQSNSSNQPKQKVVRQSKIIDNQYYVTSDTANFKRNSHKILPDDIITIGYKLHGAAHSMGKVLCKRKLSIVDKIAKFFGAKVQETEYDLVVASRRVIKNRYNDNPVQGYYSTDIWMEAAEKYKHILRPGMIIYSEVCGQTSNGSDIQKGYTYGIPEKDCDLFVYRISQVDADGNVYDFSTEQIVSYCSVQGIKTVPIFYHGKAKDKYPELDVNNHWNENFLEKLAAEYTEKDCYMNPKMPEEGVVITKQGGGWEPYKLKSVRFLERESTLLDAGEEDIENQADDL